MILNRKTLGPVAAVIGLMATVLSFQNCSQSQTSATPSTTDSTTTSSGSGSSSSSSALTALSYPVTTALNLVPGQSTTIKVTKPSTLSDMTNYVWYAYGDGHALASHVGLPVESSGSLYISLTLRSDFSGTKDLRVYFYNTATSTYLDGNGIKIHLDSTGTVTPFSADAASELCTLRSSYVPSFIFTKSAAIEDALYVFDNGAGVNALNCTFTDSAGTTSASVDCLKTSSWPSSWASQTLNVYSTNRCSTSSTQTY